MNVAHLLDGADRLASEGRSPRQTDLRRAVSAAYYAVFHSLAGAFADCLIGRGRRQSPAWLRVYRSIEHTRAKDELRLLIRASTTDSALRSFATAFVELQEGRHRADYDPTPFRTTRREVRQVIAQARAAVTFLTGLHQDTVAEAAAIVLFRRR